MIKSHSAQDVLRTLFGFTLCKKKCREVDAAFLLTQCFPFE